MSRDAIAAIVVTYQSASTLEDCLNHLRMADAVSEIRIVDNGSTDESLAIIQRHALADARVRFIANPDNPGFATACNQGAAMSQAPWLAFVNPDLLLQPDTLRRLRDAAHPLGDALLGAQLHDESGQHDPAARRKHPDFAAMLHQREARQLAIPAQPEQVLQHVPAISGALMLLPRTLFERIGGFDSHYRLHAEDLDLCRRVMDAGGKVAIHNQVDVLHLRGVSSRHRPFFVEWHKHRGLWRYYRKFDAKRHGMFVRLLVFVLIHARLPLAFWQKYRQSRAS